MNRATLDRQDIERRVREVLARIPDPEIPVVSLVDLGVIDGVEVSGEGAVKVRLLPTFVGCPALHLMREQIARDVGHVDGVRAVEVDVVLDPPWSTDRITPQGRERLREWGLTPPQPSGETASARGAAGAARGGTAPAQCPFCGSRNTRLDNAFGPTPCRAIHYCLDCRQPFERFKELF